mgnify:CR=1 FL=1
MRFAGKVVLVTGAGRGIGQTMALHYAREGAMVAVNAAHLETAEDTAGRICNQGGQALAIQASVTEENEINEMVDRVAKELGTLDILVNNAGISQPIMPLLQQSTSDWDRVVDTNYRGTYLCSKAAARHMIPHQSGKIINIASIAGLTGQIYRTAYATSKAAVINLTMVLAVELARYNINVNAVLPGYVMTDLVKDLMARGKMDLEAALKRTPLGRISTADDVALAAMFLSSEEARNITGVSLPVDAGWSAHGWYM